MAGGAAEEEFVVRHVVRVHSDLVDDIQVVGAMGPLILLLCTSRSVASDLEEIAHGRVHHHFNVLENLVVEKFLKFRFVALLIHAVLSFLP